MNHRTVKALAAATILAMGVAACSSSGSPSSTPPTSTAKMGPPLVVVDNTGQVFAQTFNPYVSTSLGTQENMQSLTYEPLLEFNLMQPTAKPVPWLASAYQWSNGNKTLTFTIRKGVKFSDGKPMTAADVAFTFNLIKKVPALDVNSVWSVLSSVTQSGDNVVLAFKAPSVPYFYYIADQIPIVPEHVWSKISNPVTYADSNPTATGAYTVKPCTPQNITYVANPDYWQPGEPKIAKVLYPALTSNDPANHY